MIDGKTVRGFEPRALSFTVKCTPRRPRQQEILLCREFLERQADARTRTADPFITSEVLYQLSYVGA